MKILLALNSFKGSCSSLAANRAIASGIDTLKKPSTCTVCPLCDGGDGSLEALNFHLQLKKVQVKTTDILGKSVSTYYLWDASQSIAYIELAAASGLARLGKRKNNILQVHTGGTGKLVNHALKKQAKRIVLLIGGSATNDAGLGILDALGVEFYDAKKKRLNPVPSNLIHIDSISNNNTPYLDTVRLDIWTDVTNPFTGPTGAVAIYSKQKGASTSQQKKLESGMLNFAKVIQKQFGVDLQKMKGTGAAGGVGGGLAGILGAEIFHGTQKIFELIQFDQLAARHDLILTGEGALDHQTQFGKLVDGVLKTGIKHNKPVIGVCGTLNLTASQLHRMGFLAAFSIVTGPIELEYAKTHAGRLLKNFGKNLKSILDFAHSSSSSRE